MLRVCALHVTNPQKVFLKQSWWLPRLIIKRLRQWWSAALSRSPWQHPARHSRISQPSLDGWVRLCACCAGNASLAHGCGVQQPMAHGAGHSSSSRTRCRATLNLQVTWYNVLFNFSLPAEMACIIFVGTLPADQWLN